MEEQFELTRKAILEELPQIPFIIDQVSDAIDWCIEEHETGIVARLLDTALDVAKYAKEISERNFYKTHLVIAALIGDIPDVLTKERFDKFKSASGIIEKAIKNVIIDPQLIQDRGCFNALSIHLANLARTDEECLNVVLYGILHDINDIVGGLKEVGQKAPITPQNYITILGYAYVLANFRMANLSLLNHTRDLINKISIVLNNDVTY